MRLIRFVRYVRYVRMLHRLHLVTRHNIRAAWLQSGPEPEWVAAFDDITDEEFDDYIRALS